MEQENDTAMRRKEMASRDHRPDVFLGGKPHRQYQCRARLLSQ